MKFRPIPVVLACLVSTAFGQGSTNEPGKTGSSLAELTIVHDVDGSPILAVKYPWKWHSGVSVEVCLVKEGQDPSRIYPHYFAQRYLKGDMRLAVYRCEDRSQDAPTITSIEEGEWRFSLLGSRNSLGLAAVAVSIGYPPDSLKTAPPHAAFSNLSTWAGEDGTLYLNLPAEAFCRAGTLKVWLMRGEAALWTATLDWPESALGPWKEIANRQDAAKNFARSKASKKGNPPKAPAPQKADNAPEA